MKPPKYSKEDIVDYLKSTEVGLCDGEAKELLNGFFDTLKSEISNDKTIKFQGFGSFKKIKRASRKARNFKTGDVIQTKEFNTIKFIISKSSYVKLT